MLTVAPSEPARAAPRRPRPAHQGRPPRAGPPPAHNKSGAAAPLPCAGVRAARTLRRRALRRRRTRTASTQQVEDVDQQLLREVLLTLTERLERTMHPRLDEVVFRRSRVVGWAPESIMDMAHPVGPHGHMNAICETRRRSQDTMSACAFQPCLQTRTLTCSMFRRGAMKKSNTNQATRVMSGSCLTAIASGPGAPPSRGAAVGAPYAASRPPSPSSVSLSGLSG